MKLVSMFNITDNKAMKSYCISLFIIVFSFVTVCTTSHHSLCVEATAEHIELEDAEKEIKLCEDNSLNSFGESIFNKIEHNYDLPLFDDQIQLEVSTPPPETFNV